MTKEVPQLMPLLLRSLEIPDMDVRAGAIDALLSISEEDSMRQTAIAEHVSTLVSTMIKNALAEGEGSSVRFFFGYGRYVGVLIATSSIESENISIEVSRHSSRPRSIRSTSSLQGCSAERAIKGIRRSEEISSKGSRRC